MLGFVIFMFFLAIAVVLLIKCMYVVNQQTVYVIERLGKFARISDAGFHFKIPIIEVIVGKVDLRTNQSSFPIAAKTSDNVTIRMNVAVQYCVENTRTGVYNAFYRLADPVAQMNSYIVDALRSAVPSYTLDQLYESKDEIAQGVQQQIAECMREYGYIIQSTLITDIDLPQDVEKSMNKINSAQREQQAAQALAEAERIKVVTEARAQAEAMEQAGRGIAAQRKAIADGIADSLETIKSSGVSTQEANTLFLFTQWCDMMERFAKSGRASTVVLPSDFSQSAGMFEQMLSAQAANTNTNGAASAAPAARREPADTF